MGLPNGIITLVFTDIESSSELSEQYREEFEPLRALHFRLLREAMTRRNGIEVGTAGDALFLVFQNSADAVRWAVEVQQTFAGYDWPYLTPHDASSDRRDRVEIRVRIGMHTGEPFLSQDAPRPDYFGPVVNRAARVSSAAYGGQILLSESTYALSQSDLPTDIRFLDCGLHRLKGVGEDHLYQVLAAGLIETFPPLKTLDPERHNLPVPPTPYFGRETEIKDWLEKIRLPTTRLLTLTGFGGMGKTRSALHMAELCQDEYKDGVWWVETEEARNADEMMQRLAMALRIPPQPDVPIREQVFRFLKDRELLLVLDNMEQVEGAGKVVKELLTQCVKVKLLVTSRRTLDIQAERVIELNPLSASEAVQLFVGRIRDRQPEFELTADNSADVAELCTRLDGVPLALELAASRIAMIAPRQMLQRLNERFKLLQTRAPDLPERQRALRAAIDWSYDLLTEDDQRLFGQLSVFAGGFTLEDAEAVCEAFDVFEGIAELRRHSLLRNETEVETQHIRFLMLNSLREYAQEKLDSSGEGQATRLRYARYFAQYVAEQLAQMRTAQEVEALRNLEVNADNLRAAAEAAQKEGETELFARLCLLRGNALFRRGFPEEAAHPVQAGLDSLEAMEADCPVLYAELLLERAWLCLDQNEIARSHTLAMQAQSRFLQSGNLLGQAHVANLLGYAADKTQRYREARAYFEQALSLLQSPQQDTDIGNTYSTFGLMEGNDPAGDLGKAAEHLQKAMQIRRKQADRRGLAEALTNLGIVAYRQGNWSQVWTYWVEALQHEQALRNYTGVARTLSNLAEVAKERNEIERSLRLAAAAEYLMDTAKSAYAIEVARFLDATAEETGKEEQATTYRLAARGLPLDGLISWAMQE